MKDDMKTKDKMKMKDDMKTKDEMKMKDDRKTKDEMKMKDGMKTKDEMKMNDDITIKDIIPCLLLFIPYNQHIMAVDMIGGKATWEARKQQME